jgi:hypothetical protein
MNGAPEEILYDRMKTVWNGFDDLAEIIACPVTGLCSLLRIHATSIWQLQRREQQRTCANTAEYGIGYGISLSSQHNTGAL